MDIVGFLKRAFTDFWDKQLGDAQICHEVMNWKKLSILEQ